QEDHPVRALVGGAVQPLDGLVRLTEADVNGGDAVRRHIAARGETPQLFESGNRFVSLARPAQRMAERRERKRDVLRQRDGLPELSRRLLEQPLLLLVEAEQPVRE